MGYKIHGNDIEALFEGVPIDIAATYGVTDSNFTDNHNRFQKGGRPLKEAMGKTFPTSAGAYIGGSNKTSAFKAGGQPIDVALKGCRPIGIPIARLTPGTHYVNRVNGETWLSSLPDSATGTRLEYNPKYMHVELLGGGGGGGGTGLACASAGGGGGGYCYIPLAIPENSHLKFVVGAKGNGSVGRGAGSVGGTSEVFNADGMQICAAFGGGGGGYNTDPGGAAGEAVGGIVNISGGNGGNKENNGVGVIQTLVTLDKPEQTVWTRGGMNGGVSSGNNYGGGGGASAFSDGAAGNSRETPSPAVGYGGGGAGGGYFAKVVNGGDGADGLINLYY